ncbi:MAG: four helix bundle protein [Terrimicrobiaceae bacterium]|nr:four helix bundle protein [Terrimicrobiaceae bacterium]
MFNFEKLQVWKEALALADDVYRMTSAFPGDERFGLTTQMRRAAVSISSNLAEGASRHSHADYARFVELASGSLYELVSQSFIASRQSFLAEPERASLCSTAEKVSKMLSGLRNHLVNTPRWLPSQQSTFNSQQS